jgi:excisionase family DNA binding protein
MNNKNTEKYLLDENGCTAYLGISKNTIYSWVNQRKMPYIKVSRSARFDPKDIENWINKNKVKEYEYKEIF